MYTRNGVMPRALGSLMEDILSNGINKVWGEESVSDRADVAVNIKETDKAYELHVVAPGLCKEQFKLHVDRNILTVSFEKKEEETEENAKWLRSEYKFKSFKRSFTLNEKIDSSAISASYNDGILNVKLPKKEPVEVTTQEIPVS